MTKSNNEYRVHCSLTGNKTDRFNFESWFYVVDASTADEAKKIIAEEDPYCIITSVEEVSHHD